MEIKLIPSLSDNYIYTIHSDHTYFIIDPAEAQPVITSIGPPKAEDTFFLLNTHHHMDHIAGNQEIKEYYNCTLTAPKDSRIPSIDQIATPGEKLQLGPLTFEIIAQPGHTSTHIAYYISKEDVVFCGDSLFAGGCGRVFEGTMKEMLHTLHTLNSLPDQTRIYCGHEYTLNNLEFALSLEPENKQLLARYENEIKKRKENLPTLPTTLAIERETNPFLRGSDPIFKAALSMESKSELEVFTHVRHLKDQF